MLRSHRRPPLVSLTCVFAIAVSAALTAPAFGQGGRGGRGGRGGGAAPQTAEQAAPLDLTGYWVSLVTEDWRFRMITPPKGDYASITMTPAGRAIADAWDPDKDIAAGQQCKSYGAAGLMRVPTRLHITWADPETLKVETDAGTQTRLLHFGDGAAPSADSLQGFSAASWDGVGRGGRGGFGGGGGGRGGAPAVNATAAAGLPPGTIPPPAAAAPPAAGNGGAGAAIRPGSLKIVTTHLSPGYLRKNGVPYGSKTVLTEYFDRTYEPNGDSLLIVTTIVDDPEYIQGQFVTSTHFKKLADSGPGWNPTACEAK